MTPATTVTWMGHAAVLVETRDGRRVLFDPYAPGDFDGAIAHAPVPGPVDIVAMTHFHSDHCHLDPRLGAPLVADGAKQLDGIATVAVPAYHDEDRGARRGLVRMLVLEVDGVRVGHLGDLGASLSAGQRTGLGPLDLAVVPVGGTYTLDGRAMAAEVDSLAPKAVLPIHYRTSRCTLPLDGVEPFVEALRGRGWDVERPAANAITLPFPRGAPRRRVLLLKPQR